MPLKKNATPVKPPECSTMIHEESEDMSFRMSQLENNMGNMEKRMEKKLEEMGKLEKIIRKKLEEGMDKIVNIIQHTQENIPNGDNVGQGAHDDRNISHFEKPSFSKHTLGGFDYNTRSSQEWFLRGIQLTKIDMSKFDGKDPIMWIFQMEQLFDLH
jgi:hypothetical protein